jgi:hypothetical protein
MELPDLPEGWQWQSLLLRDKTWFCFASNGLYYLQASGSTPRYAILDAIQRIEDEAYHEMLSRHKDYHQDVDIVALLEIKTKPNLRLKRI